MRKISVAASVNAYDFQIARQAMDEGLSQAKENAYRECIRKRAEDVISRGCVADVSRLEEINLKSAHGCRVTLLSLLDAVGLTASRETLPLSGDCPPLVYTSVDFNAMLRVDVADARKTEGSYSRVIPLAPSLGPSPLPTLDSPLSMAGLAIVREGASAALAAASKSWWFEALYLLSDSLGYDPPDIVRGAAPLCQPPPFSPP